MINPKNLVELVLDEAMEGVFAISLVKKPAIESDFLALSDSKVLLKVEDADKRIVTGAILIPNLPILRKKEDGSDYHIFFSEDTVEALAGKYLKDANQAEVTVEHMAKVEGVTLIESWIKKDAVHDKSVHLGVDAPIGTWMGSMKVEDDEIWEDWIKAGHLRGFSVEAQLKPIVKMSKVEQMLENITNMLAPKKEAVELEAQEEVVQAETVTKDEFIALCGQVEELGDLMKKFLESQITEEVEEVKAEAVEEVKAEEVVEEEEKVEMLSHVDADEAVVIETPKFNYKLSVQERIAESMKAM